MTRRRAAGSVVAGLVLALVSAGCDRRGGERARAAGDAGAAERMSRPAPATPEVAVLTGVAIQWSEGAAPPGVSDEELSRRMGAVLTGSPAFLTEGETAPAGRVAVPVVVRMTMHAEVVTGDGRRATPEAGAKDRGKRAAQGREALVGLEAEIDFKARGERTVPRENVIAARALPRRPSPGDAEVIVALAGEAVARAGRGLLAKETLRQGDDAAVLAAIGAAGPDDADATAWALDVAADRRLTGAFDRAVALLGARDAGVRAAALRVLVGLRDPRAVTSLARAADFADADTMRLLIEAVTAIGGPDAVEFLELVASGHSEADMRQRAQEGLDRLGRRQSGRP